MVIGITNTKIMGETCDKDMQDEAYSRPMDNFSLVRYKLVEVVLGMNQVIHNFAKFAKLMQNSCILVVFELALPMLTGRAFSKFMVSLAQDVIDDAH